MLVAQQIKHKIQHFENSVVFSSRDFLELGIQMCV
ncbi:hypothetical protein HS327_00807 [Glaesserella parasuis]|uniref:Uncharacterized protein n=1 Tax=Actinobacillus sp. TaxID=41114 RepID=A0A894TKM4_9PAST|nr:hypothetical protein HS327_00807 [Glaesserella parasuis]QRX38477.1 hypothetical protein [Actinobacillus sp.]QHB36519.1 hypothetical protein [Glaesserella parasuis]QOW02338.1 hypothetical protein [Glaesserella parasuis]QOW02431.1 hypothetical protein [Glaesserella parasuis]